MAKSSSAKYSALKSNSRLLQSKWSPVITEQRSAGETATEDARELQQNQVIYTSNELEVKLRAQHEQHSKIINTDCSRVSSESYC